jgi:cytochrome c oxidase accessory protein FixG
MSVPSVHDRVLSTLNPDGTRHKIRPRLAKGRFLRRRQIVGYTLIAVFVALPFVSIGGKPAMLLDLISREFVFFGSTFRPSDGVLLMLLGLAIALSVFLITALFGRVWCGYGCPQSVYLEMVFRPIERWIEGSPGEIRRRDAEGPDARRVAKWIVFGVLSFAIANVFLAYFVGVDRLSTWITASPVNHPVGFAVVVAVTGLMFFDFAWFREQACIVACPYGRLQSVLLDRQSLIVGYVASRGEPRGKPRKKLPVVGEAALGDCVDCSACVAVCPTGIDIRDGLQMECIGCAQCIDACDDVMGKLGRDPGLIRYTSQDELAGKPRKVVRVRTLIYPALLAIAIGFLVWSVGGRAEADVWVLRHAGATFQRLPGDEIASQLQIKIENHAATARRYRVALVDVPDARLISGHQGFEIAAGGAAVLPVVVVSPADRFRGGSRPVKLRVTDEGDFEQSLDVVLAGPESP